MIVAGSGTKIFVDGKGTAAKFSYPVRMTFDRNDNRYVIDLLYIDDGFNHCIRKVNQNTGMVSTLAIKSD